MQFAAKRNVGRNCPARLAPVGNEATHVQLRQSKLQPLQTLVHQQWEVCWSQKLLTAVLFPKFMRTAAKEETYSNCPAWLAPLGNRETRNWARCTLLMQPVKTLFHCQREVGKSQKSLTTAVSHIYANYNKEKGLRQLPSTVGTTEQREYEQAADFANLGSSSLRSLQVGNR